MRGLSKAAALFLLPALAWASNVASEPSNDPFTSAVIKLGINTVSSGLQQVELQLDLSSFGTGCSEAIVQARGLGLGRIGNSGYGTLPLKDGGNIGTTWSYNCMTSGADTASEQVLFVNVDKLNGEETAVDTKFAVTFRQDPPAIVAVHGAEYVPLVDTTSGSRSHERPGELANGHSLFADDELPSGEALVIGMEVELIRHRIAELRRLLKAKEITLFNLRFPNGAPHPEQEAESAAILQQENVSSSENMKAVPVEGHKEHPLVSSTQKSAPSTAVYCQETPLTSQLSELLLIDEDMFTYLGLAAIFFGLLSLFGVAFLQKRLLALRTKEGRRSRHAARRQRRWQRHRESREERWARHAVRWEAKKAAIRAWFGRICARLMLVDVEKEAMLQEQRREEAQRHTEVVRPITPETTMEQEIARFRAAASMVGDLVAAEEGRSQLQTTARPPAPSAPAAPAAPPVPPRPTIPTRPRVSVESARTIGDEESLPAYEEWTADSFMVADGFRYMRSSSEFTTSNSSDASLIDSHNSDRLGYNK